MISKLISLIIGVLDIILALYVKGMEGAFYALIYVLVCYLVIWITVIQSGYVGPSGSLRGGSYITQESPAELVRFMGWVILLLPIIIYLLFL